MSEQQLREAEQLVAAVAEAYGVAASEILSEDRAPRLYGPRCCVARAMQRRGFMQMDIARVLQRDHSTVGHAFERAAEIPGCAAIADSIAAQPYAELELNNALRPLFESQRSLVRAYVDSAILHRRRASASEEYRGLAVLSASPIVRQRCVAALELLGGGGYAWRMRAHAERLGMRWRVE